MAKPNYSFQKRQRELAKKKKKEDRLQEKLQRKAEQATALNEQAADSSIPLPPDVGDGADHN